jgi:cysteine desulfurase / selenocysteine lyase
MKALLAAPSAEAFLAGAAARPEHVRCRHGECPGIARSRFPILRQQVNGRGLVYLDSAATAQKPDEVIEAEARYYREQNANVHRGIHHLADLATTAYEACRERVADFIDAPSPQEVVITRNATHALNMAAYGLAPFVGPGDEIIVTQMDHHANLVPWYMLAKRNGAHIRQLGLQGEGDLDLGALETLLNARTRVVAVSLMSNVLGTINPISEIAELVHRHGATLVVDAAQAVGHLPVSFAELDADLLAFSSHKAYGPMGQGFLIGRPELLERMEPMEGGGEMIDEVGDDDATWTTAPLKFEAGTPNVAAAAAFPKAIDLLESVGMTRVREHEIELVAEAIDLLASIDGLVLYGPSDPTRRGGLVSFYDPLLHPHDLATVLDNEGIAVRVGHHCAQPLHRALGVDGTTRASIGIYSNRADLEALAAGIRSARKFFS